MDRDARAAVAFKLVLDSVAAALMLYSLDMCYMVYMKEYHFTAYSILHEFTYYNVDSTSEIEFEEFKQRKCVTRGEDETTNLLCEVLLDARLAGAAYLIFTAVTIVLMTYNALNTLGKVCYFSCGGVIQRKEAQFAVFPLYLIGVLLYVQLSGLFTRTVPDNPDLSSSPDTGFFVMSAALLVNMGSFGYYIATLSDLGILEAADSMGLQKLVQRHLALSPR